MQIAVEKLDGLNCRLKITVPSDEFEKAYNERISKVAKSAKVDGFRVGKVPPNVIESRYGRGVRQEVAGELMQKSFQDAVVEHKLKVAGMPKIETEEFKQGAPLEYTATFETYPEIKLQDLTGTKIKREKVEITDADVAKMLEKVSKMHADWVEVERKSKQGDRVVIDFEGFLNNKPFEGGKAEKFSLELGSKQMIPGFEESLVGVEAEQECDIKVTFPKEYPVEELAGQETTFKIKVHKVEEPKLPELNDEFAEKVGIKGGIEALRTDVRSNLERESSQILKSKLKEEVFNKFLELNPIEVPHSLIENEIDHMHQSIKSQMATAEGKGNLPELDLPREPYLEEAKKRVALGLLLAEVIGQYNIKVDADLVRDKVNEIAKAYQKPEEVVNWYYRNKHLITELEAAVLEEQAVNTLLEAATVEEKATSYAALTKAPAESENS